MSTDRFLTVAALIKKRLLEHTLIDSQYSPMMAGEKMVNRIHR